MDYLKINRDAWNKRTQVHVGSDFYDVEGFLAGACSLNDIELAELGDVEGKTLLHLQCHFGLDTLSWARRGANVTGVDLSPAAIEKAEELRERAGLDAELVCSDVYAFGETCTKTYDIVFTSYGTICWLPSLEKWADTIARCLKPGGTFYMAEFHPAYDLVTGYPYFHSPEPDVEEEGTYTENCPGETSKMATWAHPLSEVIGSLLAVGIRIDLFNEYPYSPYDCFENMEEREKGKFYIRNNGHDVPMVYTIRGTRL